MNLQLQMLLLPNTSRKIWRDARYTSMLQEDHRVSQGSSGWIPQTLNPKPQTLLGGSGDLVTTYFIDFISIITQIGVPFRVLSQSTYYLLTKSPRLSKHPKP